MIDKDKLEKWGNRNLMTFGESNHGKSCLWDASAIWTGDLLAGESSAERTGGSRRTTS